MSQTLADRGEFEILTDIIAELHTNPELLLVGPGDDAAVLAPTERATAITKDLLIEQTHFRLDWASAEDVGHKAAAQNLADVVAMGAVPTGLLVGLAAPGHTPVQWVREFYQGFQAECQKLGAVVIGGDMSAAPQIVISVTALGSQLGRPLLRQGAQVGDVLALAGRVGEASAGLSVLQRGFRSPRQLVQAQRRPEPPYDAALAAVGAGATAMIDVSDGLLADASHIAYASEVLMSIDSEAFPVPDAMRDAGAALGIDPQLWQFTGGEDHSFLATFPTDAKLPEGFRVVGHVLDGSQLSESERGLVLVDGKVFEAELAGGFEHWRHQ